MANHLDDNNYGYALLLCGWIFAALGAVAVGLRIWSRWLRKQNLMLNDWFAITALIFNIALVSHTTHSIFKFGLGQHASVIGAYNVGQVLKSLFGIKPEWAFANAFVKLSILHLYTTIFPQKWFRITAYIMMVLAVLYSLSALLEIFFSCFPMPYLWDPAGNPGGYCINLGEAWLAVGLTNMIEDIIIILLPLPVLWSLQLDTRRKLIITAIFSLGIFIIVITAIRIKVIMDFDPQDASGHLGPITFWSILEPLLGLINCCLPVIQPAISKVSGHRVWSAPNSRPDKDRGYNWGPKISRDGPSNGHFSKLDNLYPLTTVQVMSQDDVYANHIGSSTHAVAVDQGDLEKAPSTTNPAPEAIVVEKKWEVSSDSM